MNDSIHDDEDEWSDRPLRPRGMGNRPADVMYIVVAAVLVGAMMGLIILAAFEK